MTNTAEKEILGLLDVFSGISLINPRYEYYSNLITKKIKESYEKGLLSDVSEYVLRMQKASIEDRIQVAKYRSVFAEYKRLSEDGSNILAVVSLQDLLYCRGVCEKMIKMSDGNKLVLLTSDMVKSKCIENLLTECEQKLDNPDSNILYKNLNCLEKYLFDCRRRSNYWTEYDKYYHRYIAIREHLLEVNKEYYYMEDSAVKQSEIHAFTQKSDDFYFRYYQELYRVKFTKIYFDKDYTKYKESFNNLLNEIDSLNLNVGYRDGLRTIIYDLKESVNKTKYSYEEVYTILMEAVYERPEFLGCYSIEVLTRCSVLAQDFVDTFDKVGLIRYCLVYAKLVVISNALRVDSIELYNDTLEAGLDNLMAEKVISMDEKIAIYNKYRRSDLNGSSSN